jgi:hypothetical protein
VGEHCEQEEVDEGGLNKKGTTSLQTGEIAAISVGISSTIIIALLAILIMCQGSWICNRCRRNKQEPHFQYARPSDTSDNVRATLPPLNNMSGQRAQQWPGKKATGRNAHYYPESSPDWDVTTL